MPLSAPVLENTSYSESLYLVAVIDVVHVEDVITIAMTGYVVYYVVKRTYVTIRGVRGSFYVLSVLILNHGWTLAWT